MRFLDWKLPWKETPVLVGREEEGSISGQSYTVGHSSQLCENILNPKFEKNQVNKKSPKNQSGYIILYFVWYAPLGRSIGFEIGGLEAGEKIQNLFS